MEDTTIPCPFCSSFLTDVDGMLECQEGCHAHTAWDQDTGNGPLPWWYKEQLLYIFNLYEWINLEGQTING